MSDTPSTRPRRRRRRWAQRLGITAVLLVAAYALAGFLLLPWLLTGVVPSRVSDRLAGELSVGAAAFNPFTFALSLDDVAVMDEQGRAVARFARFEGRFEAIASLAQSGWHFDHARLVEPYVDAELAADGTLNLAQLVLPDPSVTPTARAPREEIPHVVVRDLRVTAASGRFTDRMVEPAFERSISDVDFIVERLDTEPSHDNPHRLEARIGQDTVLRWTGTAYADPLTAEGTLVLENLDLAQFSTYVEQRADLAVAGGRLDVQFSYTLAPVRSARRLVLDAGEVVIRDLATTTAGQPLLAFQRLSIDGLGAELRPNEVRIGRVALDGLDLAVRRRVDGTLEVQSLVPSGTRAGAGVGETTTTRATTVPAALVATRPDLDTIEDPIEQLTVAFGHLVEDLAAGWAVEVDRIAFADGRVQVTDDAVEPAVERSLTGLTLAAGPLSSRDGFRTPVDMAFEVSDGANVTVAGTVDPGAATAGLDVLVERLSLAPARAYLPTPLPEPYANARFDGASLDLAGRVEAGMSGASWEGRAAITSLITSRAGGPAPLQFEQLTVHGRAELRLPSASSETADTSMDWDGTLELGGLAAEVWLQDRPHGLELANLATTGVLGVRLPPAGGGEMAIQWTGRLDLGGLAADFVQEEQPQALRLASIGTDGVLGLRVPAAGSGDLTIDWNGRFALGGLAADLVQDDQPQALRLGAVGTEGVLGLRLPPGEARDLAVNWDGTLELGELSADLVQDAQPQALRLATVETTGVLGMLVPPGGAGDLSVDWNGTLAIGDVAADLLQADQPQVLRLARAAADGTVGIRRPPTDAGDPAIDWKGTFDLGALAADLVLEDRPHAVRVDQFRTDGELGLQATADGPEVRWSGGLRSGAVEARGAADPDERSVTIDEAVLANAILAWSAAAGGSFDAASLTVRGPRLAAHLLPPAASPPGGTAGTSGPATATAPSTAPAPPFVVRLERLSVAEGAFAIEDRRTATPVRLVGSGATVEVTGIDSGGGTPMTVSVQSGLGETGSVSLEGSVDPFRALPLVDVAVGVTDVPLRPLSPAAEPSLGYAIDSGRLSLSLPIRVRDGRLDGKLSARLDNFFLGDKKPSATAPDLPLKLGLALLRDPDQSISADLGISGDTTAPGFAVGDVIWKAAFNLVGGIASSPFKLIAGLFGGDEDEDLSAVEFEPGGTTLVTGAARDLDVLSRGLRERPTLALEVVGVTGPEDELALRERALAASLTERRMRGGNEADALAALFSERFPNEVRPQVPVPPGRLDQPRLDPAAMRSRLLAGMSVDPTALAALARQRAEQVRRVLVDQNGVDTTRVTLAEVTDPDLAPSPRASFELITRRR